MSADLPKTAVFAKVAKAITGLKVPISLCARLAQDTEDVHRICVTVWLALWLHQAGMQVCVWSAWPGVL